MRNETEKTQAENANAKLIRFAEGMVRGFRDEVAEGDRQDTIYDLLDYMKDFRVDCPESVYEQATKLAVKIYEN
jgi:hypothetical protein